MNLSRVKELTNKTFSSLKEDGVKVTLGKTKRFLVERKARKNRPYDIGFKDILFINGCCLPHPQRYRVTHQIEQLESYGVSCDRIDYEKLDVNLVRYFRGFVFYRCPVTPTVEEFIRLAKENNKTVFYDIDDLVFDLEHTNMIKFLDSMSEAERNLYNDGVIRMGKTLDLCEYGIASTERLQAEMGKHLKEVYVNRNVMSEEMVKYSQEALTKVVKDDMKIVIGYLSGSITHNDDFKLIMPSIINVLKKYDNVYLEIVGLLDLPDEMKDVKHKVITAPFMDYRELPKLIRSIDINLAPLEDTIFNEAKSENKWTEAALVKIPTIASNVGAFKSQMVNEKTGLLCNDGDDWDKYLKMLIEDKSFREEIGLNAYNEVMDKHVTTFSGKGVADFIMSKLHKNACFVLPSTNVSGGIMVAIKHGLILKKRGYDVTMINLNLETKDVSKVYEGEEYLYVVPEHRTYFEAKVDVMTATMWLTLDFVKKYYNCVNKKYLVQNMERGFYLPGRFERIKATSTYNMQPGVDYITISKWCERWLKEDFGNEVKYAPNGIDLSIFEFKERNFDGKIKILIEGNCKDYYKNVDESFKIVEKLDKDKYEISYLSYEKEPKDWYHVDNFYHKVPHSKVGKIYQENDILIKTSILESFSYPPLEMMATGGLVVVVPNDGNSEYLVDGENCLLYEQGDIDSAVSKIESIVSDKKLRDKLEKGGLATAKKYEWSKIENSIVSLYEED